MTIDRQSPLTEDDVHTLVGYAVMAHGRGTSDVPPRFLLGLAERIALSLGDEEAAKLVRASLAEMESAR